MRQAAVARSFVASLTEYWAGVDDMIAKAHEEMADPTLFYSRRSEEKRTKVFKTPLDTTPSGSSPLT
jgi:hypothetical protein